MGTEKYYTVLKILIRFVVAVYQRNNSKSATDISVCKSKHTKNFFKLPDIPDNFMNST